MKNASVHAELHHRWSKLPLTDEDKHDHTKTHDLRNSIVMMPGLPVPGKVRLDSAWRIERAEKLATQGNVVLVFA